MLSSNTLLVLSILQACLVPNLIAAPSPVSTTTEPQATQKGTKASGRTLKFETYADAKGESRWRLKSSNGQVIATSGQGYKDKRDCKNAIDRIKKDAKKLKFETYADAKGETRWRLKSTNGQVIATSGQGYKDKRDSENAISVIKEGAESARVEEAS
jgi:uncharacterized protein YegP (UPF0339 family)